jgi:hypothetical protein
MGVAFICPVTMQLLCLSYAHTTFTGAADSRHRCKRLPKVMVMVMAMVMAMTTVPGQR